MEASCSISPKYIIPNHVLTSDRVLGSGGFGVVHHGGSLTFVKKWFALHILR